MNTSKRIGVTAIATLAMVGAFAVPALANHSWNGYHWARTGNPFVLKLGDNLSGPWKSFLLTTSTDWSLSTVLDTSIVAGSGGRNCRSQAGTVQVCNSKYGQNGWLGIAAIWTSGDHITMATVKMNDTYFTRAPYNTVAWKNLVMCQEVGHTLGLDHQDEIFDNLNLGTCMDYTSDPSTNQHPNQHDYDMLEQIYAHLDPVSTLSSTRSSATQNAEDNDDPRTWGREKSRSRDGRVTVFEQDLGNGDKVVRHVYWASPADRPENAKK